MNKVSLFIDGNDFSFWDNLTIDLPIDSFRTFSLSAPFDPDVPLLRNTFRPLSFKRAAVKIDDEQLLTGRLFVRPEITTQGNIVTCGGYSLPGVLNDCEFPPDNYPLEFSDVDLRTIAEKAAQPFEIPVQFDEPPGVVFPDISATPDNKIFDFLVSLAKQRGLLVTDTPAGAMRFYKPAESGKTTAALHQDQDRFIAGAPMFNDQKFYSSITGLSPSIIERFSENFTVNNGLLSGVIRPHTFTITDTTDVDIQTTVKAKAGRMIAESAGYEVTVQGWRDDLGEIWGPGKIVKLLAPGIMVYRETEFLIKNVRLSRNAENGDTAILQLVFPGTYSGKIPEVVPWLDS